MARLMEFGAAFPWVIILPELLSIGVAADPFFLAAAILLEDRQLDFRFCNLVYFGSLDFMVN